MTSQVCSRRRLHGSRVAKPHAAMTTKLAKKLGMKPNEITTYWRLDLVGPPEMSLASVLLRTCTRPTAEATTHTLGALPPKRIRQPWSFGVTLSYNVYALFRSTFFYQSFD